jgi:hypothetical protein
MTVADLAGTQPNPYPDEEKALNAALAKAQGEFPPIAKDKTAKAGSYSYSYADLASIIDHVRPVLAKHGLSVIQPIEAPNGVGLRIRTELRHIDGGKVISTFPLNDDGTDQQLGSRQTYRRRYAYCAILGIAPQDEDDDATVASATSIPQVAEASPFTPPEPRQEPLVEDLTSSQRKTIYALKTKLTGAGLFDDEQFKAALVKAYGTNAVSGLDKGQASELIGRLKIQEDALDQETTP